MSTIKKARLKRKLATRSGDLKQVKLKLTPIKMAHIETEGLDKSFEFKASKGIPGHAQYQEVVGRGSYEPPAGRVKGGIFVDYGGGIRLVDWYTFSERYERKNVKIYFLSSIKVFILANVYILNFLT